MISDLYQRFTEMIEYTLKLPYLQHSLLARRVFFISSIHASAALYCITTSAALGSWSLIFKHQHCYLFSKHQHCYLIFKHQHCYLFSKHHHCSRSSSVFTAFRSSSVFIAFRSSSVTTTSTALYWPLSWHFHWIYTSREVSTDLPSGPEKVITDQRSVPQSWLSFKPGVPF